MNSSRTRTFYDILGLDKSASSNDVKDAYKKMALRWHPDKNPDDLNAVSVFQEISEAYETLYDHDKRMHYNYRIGASRSSQSAAHTFARPYPGSFTGNPYSHYASQPKNYPDWFWSGKNPSATKPAEDPLEGESKRREAEKNRRAARQEEKRAAKGIDIKKRLGVTLSTIARLSADIERLELEDQETARSISRSGNEPEKEDEPSFWHTVFERNVTLNTLRRDHETSLHEYRKLTRSLSKVDIEASMEAQEIFRQLKKKKPARATNAPDNPMMSDEGIRMPKQKPHYSQEEQDVLPSSPTHTNQDETPYDYGNDGEYWSEHEAERYEPNSSCRADNEAMYRQARMNHAMHEEVHAEFWSFVEDCQLCCFCGNQCIEIGLKGSAGGAMESLSSPEPLTTFQIEEKD